MKRLLLEWAGGGVVGRAVNVLHFDQEATGLAAAVFAATDELHPWLPLGVTVTTPQSGDLIDDATGLLTGGWAEGTGGGTKAGSGAGASAAGVGAVVGLETATVINGHRVRGRIFVVPLSTSAYDAVGTLVPDAVTALTDFGEALNAAGLVVWHRPPVIGQPGGQQVPVATVRVRDKVAILRSRRD